MKGDIVERLREDIVAAALKTGVISYGEFADRLITERRDAANEITRLRGLLIKAIRERNISARELRIDKRGRRGQK